MTSTTLPVESLVVRRMRSSGTPGGRCSRVASACEGARELTADDYPREKVKGLPDEPFDLDAFKYVDFRLPGTREMLELPQMWVMCAEFAKYPETAKPVWVPIFEKLLW
ncbi:MAG: hypothetical protein ACT4NY_11210 [Pseudonocardiales bacterium]